MPLVRILRTAETGQRELLIQVLPEVNNIEGHGALGLLLRVPEAPIRAAASEILQRIGGKTAFDV